MLKPDLPSDLEAIRTERHEAGFRLLMSLPAVFIGLGAWLALRKQVRLLEAADVQRELEAKEAAEEVIDVDSRPVVDEAPPSHHGE